MIEEAKKRGFTDLMLWYEKMGKPHSLILSHLPDGPTATFRVSGIKLRDNIVNHGAAPGETNPELIMNNFDTMLGHRIGRMLAALFP
jgi:ribosome production factor 1